jgi:hypothetical protein
MVVTSGALPYEYDFALPVTGPVGQSGTILEQGMFVLFAEMRKFGTEPLDSHGFNVYRHPDVPPSGFEPKGDGSTLGGDVGGPALVTINNLLEMREALSDGIDALFDLYADDSAYTGSNELLFREAYFTTSYPGEQGSGYVQGIQVNPFILATIGGDFQRPRLEDIDGGDRLTDTNLHWLGGSGVFFDLDVGEVVIQPMPFHRAFRKFNSGYSNPRFNHCPYYPMFQTTAGSLITLTGRERVTPNQNGFWAQNTNFEAIASGKVQVDGYAMLPETELRFISNNRNASNYFDSISSASDMTYFAAGQRQVRPPAGMNDSSARTYWTPQVQASGYYSILAVTPRSSQPLMGAESGITSIWPPIDYRLTLANRNLQQSQNASGTLKTPGFGLSQGYQVFDDCIWLSTRGNVELSGVTNSPARGLHPISPIDGALMWFRPADLTIATTGNRPSTSFTAPGVPAGTPGNFEVHLGMEDVGGQIIRLSRAFNETTSPAPGGLPELQYDYTIYFQTYNRPSLTRTSETSVSWTFIEGTAPSDPNGFAFSDMGSMFYDGSDYWIGGSNTRLVKVTGGLSFDGYYDIASGGTFYTGRAFVNGEYLYWSSNAGTVVSDPLLTDVNMANFSQGSGIGKWQINSNPPDITQDAGQYAHVSAKPIRGEDLLGAPTSALIHDIIDVTGATHVDNGIWALVGLRFGGASNDRLWLLKLEETATQYNVTEAIDLDHTVGASFGSSRPSDYPYHIIYHSVD